MTEKELLYVQAVLGHEKHFQTECRNVAEQLQDGELKSFARELEQKHSEMFQSFYGLL